MKMSTNPKKAFREIINKAAAKFIPAGRIPNIINQMPTNTAKMMEQRDKIRQANPSNTRLPELNKQINISIKEHRQKHWTEKLDNCPSVSKQLWDLIKNINNPKRTVENQSVKFDNTHHMNPSKITDKLNAQYTPPASSKPTRTLPKAPPP